MAHAKHIKIHNVACTKCYNKKVQDKTQQGEQKRMSTIDNNVTNWIGWTVGGLSILGSIAGFIAWCRRRRQKRAEEKRAVLTGIEKLCAGQQELYARMDEMDSLRNIARSEDADFRASQYLEHIALIGALIELADKMGIKINGEIKEYYRQNQDALRKGVGMAPLHAQRKDGVYDEKRQG